MRVTPVRRQRSRALRHEPTVSEARLWSWLRNRRFGDYKFRRQHAIGSFVLDFCCAELKVALEVDGRQHAEPWHAEYDDRRTAYLQTRGIDVLRVTNDEIVKDAEGVEGWLRFQLDSRKKNT